MGDTGETKRAHGRSLSDFWLGGEKGKLHPAEEQLVEACRTGELCTLPGDRPEKSDAARLVRVGLLRFLALGGDFATPVHEHGVQLQGAWIDGLLDLEGATVSAPLIIAHSRIERLTVRDARLRGLYLNGSCVEAGIGGDRLRCEGGVFLSDGFRATGAVRLLGAEIGGVLSCKGGAFELAGGNALHCDGAKVTGGVFLSDGFRATGAVRLLGAEIGGDLSCIGGTFDHAGGNTLHCDGAKVTGGVFLRDGFRATGAVRLLGAEIGGDLSCIGGTFDHADGDALSCDGAKVMGSVFLRGGFRATGAVRLLVAEIGGDLDCSGGTFDHAGGNALFCTGAKVTGGFFFRWIKRLAGGVVLSSCHVGTLADDPASWAGAKGKLILDGFTYGRIDGSPVFTDPKARIAWLDSQRPGDLTTEFRPQPWEQLAKILREMGHVNDARRVAIAKQDRLFAARRIKGRGTRALHWLYGRLTCYGYQPLRLARYVGYAWAFGSAVLFAAANPQWSGHRLNWIAPVSALADPSCLARLSADPRRPDCPRDTRPYAEFFAPAYALDTLLPVIKLGYMNEWKIVRSAPDGDLLIGGWVMQAVVWALILFGWMSGLMLVAAASNLVRKD